MFVKLVKEGALVVVSIDSWILNHGCGGGGAGSGGVAGRVGRVGASREGWFHCHLESGIFSVKFQVLNAQVRPIKGIVYFDQIWIAPGLSGLSHLDPSHSEPLTLLRCSGSRRF